MFSMAERRNENVTIYVHKDSALPTKSLFSKSLKVSVEKHTTGKNVFTLAVDSTLLLFNCCFQLLYCLLATWSGKFAAVYRSFVLGSSLG